MSLLLGLCHSVGVCSSTNLFLKAWKSSEADFLCSIDFFQFMLYFHIFHIWKIILLLKHFFFSCISNCLSSSLLPKKHTFLKLSLRSCHFLNRQPAEWNPLWASGGDYAYIISTTFQSCCADRVLGMLCSSPGIVFWSSGPVHYLLIYSFYFCLYTSSFFFFFLIFLGDLFM